MFIAVNLMNYITVSDAMRMLRTKYAKMGANRDLCKFRLPRPRRDHYATVILFKTDETMIQDPKKSFQDVSAVETFQHLFLYSNSKVIFNF